MWSAEGRKATEPHRSMVLADWPPPFSGALKSFIVAVAIIASSTMSGLAQERGIDVVGCDSLVALRLMRAASSSGAKLPPDQPGCRRIPRSDLGDVRQRAMIGGAPFECLALRGSDTCAWVAP